MLTHPCLILFGAPTSLQARKICTSSKASLDLHFSFSVFDSFYAKYVNVLTFYEHIDKSSIIVAKNMSLKQFNKESEVFSCTVEILPLALKVGRFKNIREDYRLCELCDLGEVENKSHFL